MFKRILVGYDGSRCADSALRCALNLPSGPGAHLTVVAVVSPSHGETFEQRESAFRAQADRLRMAAECHRRAAQQTGYGFEVDVVEGVSPAESLEHMAGERGFDLVVVGRCGSESASHGGLGHVAQRLAAHSSRPVLVVGDDHYGGLR